MREGGREARMRTVLLKITLIGRSREIEGAGGGGEGRREASV